MSPEMLTAVAMLVGALVGAATVRVTLRKARAEDERLRKDTEQTARAVVIEDQQLFRQALMLRVTTLEEQLSTCIERCARSHAETMQVVEEATALRKRVAALEEELHALRPDTQRLLPGD